MSSSVKRNFSLVKFLASSYVRMHRVKFYISNTLMIKLVWCLGKCVGLGFGLGSEKET